MTDSLTEPLWSRGLRDTKRALTSWYVALALAIGVTAAAVFLEPLAGLATAIVIPTVVLCFHFLRAPILQRNELRLALRGADAEDTEAVAVAKAMEAERVRVFDQDFSLAAVLLALEEELAQGWRLGTLGDGATLRLSLGVVDQPVPGGDAGLSPRAVVGRLRSAGVVTVQHLQRDSGPWPVFPGPPPSDIASLSELGLRVIRLLREDRAATK